MTPASPAPEPIDSATSIAVVDGLGVRVRHADPAIPEPLELLQIRDALATAPGFDFALRERVNRLANFRHGYYARVRRVDRLDGGATLGLVSDRVEGARLSRILEVARTFELDLDVNAALCLLRQIVPAVAMLHQNARDVSHGALAPERIVVTPNARVVLVEFVLGAAIESLGYSRERMWKELRVAVPPGAGTVRLNHRTDVMQIGVVALALVLGRPLDDDDLRRLPALIASATENSVMGGKEPISEPLRRWLTRALQLDVRGSFESALEAQLALDDVLAGDAGYIAGPVGLESFLTRYQECAARMPAPEPQPAAPPAPKVPPPAPKLGIAKVNRDAPAVPSFRAVAVAPPPPPAAAAVPEPPPLPAPDASPAAEPPRMIAPDPAPTAPRAAAEPAPVASMNDQSAEPGESFDEAALRAQFLAASGAQDAPSRGGVSSWWRSAALVLAMLVAGEGAFIAWRFAKSPAGLTGSNGTLKVESKPVGAQVKIDGEVKGVTPLALSVGAGAHVLEIAAGTEPRVIPITIAGGETVAQYVELAGVSALGRVSVQSSPAGATVLFDGQLRGKTPLDLPDVAVGEHEVVLDLNGQRVRQAISVTAGATAVVDLPMSGAPPVDLAGLLPSASAPTTGALLVQAPFEMQVFEGGTMLGVSGAKLPLPPGPHALEVVSETLSFRAPLNVEIVAGRTSRVPIALPKGVIHLNATPWAEVWIDGVKVGDTPIGNLRVTIGPHEIVFKHPELGEQVHAATVTAAAPVRLSVDLSRQP